MLKRDLFIKAMQDGAYHSKQWVFSAFSVVRKNSLVREEAPFAIYRDEQGRAYIYQGVEDLLVYIDDAVPNEPVFHFLDTLTIGPGDIPNLKKEITTTYGTLFVNWVCLVYPFGDKIDYLEGRINIGQIEKIIEKRLRATPEGDGPRDPQWLYVDEYQRFNEAAFSLGGYTQLCVPSATAKTMTTDPRIAQRRKELIEKYRDQLSDPVIQAKIGDELIAMDREWLKGDPGEGFYIKDKSYDVIRKKMFLLQGQESGFGQSSPLIETSLADGWDVNNLPAMGNALREGSYSRGFLTALGGEATKFNYRIFQNTTVGEEDCGSELGLPTVIRSSEAKSYISSSVIDKGKVVELTDENIHKYVDVPVLLRSPVYCHTPGVNFCAVCMGKKIASTPTAISTYCADIGSLFQNLEMKKMHGVSLKLAKYDFQTSIT